MDTSNPIKTLVVDDSVTYRMIMSNVVKSIPGAELCGTAANGRIALDMLHQNPVELVLMDIEMPVMGGMETLQTILRDFPKTSVILISGANRDHADLTIRALEAGALDFISKPDEGSMTNNMDTLRTRLSNVMQAFRSKRILPRSITPNRSAIAVTPATAEPPIRTASSIPSRFDVITIGISTGGPNALTELIPALPANIGVPILIVQHMPPIFTASLASSLDRKSALLVKEAEAGERVQPNTVYIAPGGQHMTVSTDFCIGLNSDPPENSCRPAVDVLFRSVGQAYKRNILALVMTGMGRDGASGVEVLKKTTNCYCITQSEQSCTVYGMPRSVDELGLSDERVDLSQLSTRIQTLLKGSGVRVGL